MENMATAGTEAREREAENVIKKNKKFERLPLAQSRTIIGPNLNFAAAEAYKLLRTNLAFSLVEEGKGRVIGITSSLAGEGKSTTAVNIAYTIAQTGKRVLLMEADLRLPTAAQRLSVQAKPGLSNLLVGQCSGNDIVQRSGLLKNLYVITAGDTPPNPTELLASEPMQQTVAALREAFDVVIIDLPPANVVSDALILSKLVSGVVIVVRQDYCEKKVLDALVRQLKFTGAKILGFVMTGSDIQKKNYKSYRKDGYYASYDQAGRDKATS